MSPETRDVCVVGGGVAGLSAAIFTARAGLDTLVCSTGESILRRNAHLENFPGFPRGVNSNALLDLLADQADWNGVDHREADVTAVEPTSMDRLTVDVAAGEGNEIRADAVVAASWADPSYLAPCDGIGLIDRGSKTFVDVDERGASAVDGLYAAGRIAGTHHQAIVAAGDGAAVGLSVVEDADVPFYHDWVVPDGYFTDRDREVPPGCEEIDETERREREEASLAAIQDAFAERHPEDPSTHPSLRD
jgi:thioredoxin reductase (NADPH)